MNILFTIMILRKNVYSLSGVADATTTTIANSITVCILAVVFLGIILTENKKFFWWRNPDNEQ